MTETSEQINESSSTYWRLAMLMTGDPEARFEALRRISGISGAGEVPVSVLEGDESPITDLFCVIWDSEADVSVRERAADQILGRHDLRRNQALALVPVAPESRRWEAVHRSIRLGVSVSDLTDAARSMRDQAATESLVNMICFAVTESTDFLYDWAEDGARVADMVSIARSGFGRASVEAGEIALLSGELTAQEVFDLTDQNFPEEVREMAFLWLRANAEPDDVFVTVDLSDL